MNVHLAPVNLFLSLCCLSAFSLLRFLLAINMCNRHVGTDKVGFYFDREIVHVTIFGMSTLHFELHKGTKTCYITKVQCF